MDDKAYLETKLLLQLALFWLDYKYTDHTGNMHDMKDATNYDSFFQMVQKYYGTNQ